jgi:hypothetical protein
MASQSSRLAFVIAIASVAATSAEAANLVNKDKRTYKVEIACESARTRTSIGPNTIQLGGFEQGCTITLGTGATLLVSGEKNVIIHAGKLSEE